MQEAWAFENSMEWRIVIVNAEPKALLEISMPGVSVLIRWMFQDLGGRNRVTQRISIAGEKSASLADLMAGPFESGAPAGMKKLC